MSTSPTPRCLAQEAVAWYFSHVDEFASHAENVRLFLRNPAIALTYGLLYGRKGNAEDVNKTAGAANWKEYLGQSDSFSPLMTDHPPKEYEKLAPRAKARLEAFLQGVTLAIPNNERESSATPTSTPKRNGNALLEQGLSGFRPKANSAMRSISVSSTSSVVPQPQIAENDLVTRLELYLRTVIRAKALGQECTFAVEPARAVKARVNAIVAAFIENVSTVRQQSAVLTRLLTTMTKEILAVEQLSAGLAKIIRRMVMDYEHTTSFASLAFLSSPESAAAKNLTPMIMHYFKHLRVNWEDLERDCALELMLHQMLDAEMRHTFKTVEFRSIGHLLEVCQSFRNELQRIEFMPAPAPVSEEEALQQAIMDLKREIITVNGQVLPPVTSRSELVQLLSQTLNSGTLAAGRVRRSKKGRRPRRGGRRPRKSNSEISDGDVSGLSSGDDGITDNSALTDGSTHRRFNVSTVDYLTKRLLMAGSRTGTGGDAYFVVRDLFGGDDVEVVPSALPMPGQSRRETIEILIRLASVTILCHGSFDVYPKSLVGTCEPLIQVHTTTQETISLQEVRAEEGTDGKEDNADSDIDGPKMIVKELITERTGLRTLSVRPALYEKVEVWNTPS